MGSEEIEEDDSLLEFKSSIKPLSLAEQLDEWCAFYMSIGVPYDEFWYGNYCKLKYYVMAHRLKKKMDNEKLWLQGMYNYEAFQVTLANGFKDKKSGKTYKYAEKPYDIVPKSEREEAIENENKKKQIIKSLNAIKSEWERKHNESSDKNSRPRNQDNE